MKNAILSVLLVWVIFPTSLFANSILVTPNTTPGSNPANDGPILIFGIVGVAVPLVPLPPIPETSPTVIDPNIPAFDSYGELFVSNRHGNVAGQGSIARFVLDPNGNFLPNGAISAPGNGLDRPHGLAFSPSGELFVANFMNGLISRYEFDAGGNAIPNGTFSTGQFINLGAAFSPNGELFTTHDSNEILRWVFDVNGNAIANGSFTVPDGSARLHYLGFSPAGELFAPDLNGNKVYRVLFDNSGNPIANGFIDVAGGPLAVAFGPQNELFVASHFIGGISRFLFDQSGNPIPNGFTPTVNLGGVAVLTDIDLDGDGVVDENELPSCLSTPEDSIVNPLGCSVEQICPCAMPLGRVSWSNHGEYVDCITKAAREFRNLGLLSNSDSKEIVIEAARSDCGK